MKRGDAWIAVVLIAAVALFAVPRWIGGETSEAAAFAEITVDGEYFETIALTEESREVEIRTERGVNVLRVSDGGIRMIEADCPDQLCLGFGHIHRENETIVCLPNRVFVEIVASNGGGDGLDAVVT